MERMNDALNIFYSLPVATGIPTGQKSITSHLKSIFRPQIAQDKQTDYAAFILKSEKSVK
jgi:hypothetical protein